LLAAVAAATLIGPALAGPSGSRAIGQGHGVRVSAPAGLPECGPAASATRGVPSTPDDATWYRIDPVVDSAGELTGQRLALGRVADRSWFGLELAVESFASGPSGGLVVVGDDDGRRSIVRLVDVAGRCATVVHDDPDVVRRAILEASGEAIVEFRLQREARADLGVWRRPLDGSPARRILDPLPANARIGLVFSTELAWSADGRRLVVTSCGEAFCLARIVEPATGRVVTLDEAGIGEPIGLIGDELVAYGACPALPCRIVSRSLATGRTRALTEVAGLATVAPTGGGVVVFEATADGRLASVRVDGTGRADLPLEAGQRLVPAAHRALAAIELPAGLVAVAADGRPAAAVQPAMLIDVATGRRLPAAEVVP
jgi:hypothetical protein